MQEQKAYNLYTKSKDFVELLREDGFIVGFGNIVKLPIKNAQIKRIPKRYHCDDFAYAGQIVDNRFLIITDYDGDAFYRHATSRLQKLARDFQV
ncbi:MAG TPA: hypothetical protein VMC80_01155 [Patescibacteria group bacterium]|nr:hypothetical protein [Patescibacteria group bacterium]